MTTQPDTATVPLNGAVRGFKPAVQVSASSGAILAPPPKMRRRPMLIAASIILVAVGALLAAYLTTVVGNTRPVVAVRAGVARGQVITRNDLDIVRITPDPALHTIPAALLSTLVGQHAAVDLLAGGLVTTGSATAQVVPTAGNSLVGVALTPAQLPVEPLQPGDKVRIVDTPRQQDDPPSRAPASIPATVVASHPVGDQGQVVVDVTVPQQDAATLAAVTATGRVALVVDGTGS